MHTCFFCWPSTSNALVATINVSYSSPIFGNFMTYRLPIFKCIRQGLKVCLSERACCNASVLQGEVSISLWPALKVTLIETSCPNRYSFLTTCFEPSRELRIEENTFRFCGPASSHYEGDSEA